MSRPRAVSSLAKVAFGAAFLTLFAVACDEDGKTVPSKCVDTAEQPIFDIKTQVPPAGALADYGAIPSHDNPCITNTGHAISPVYGGSSNEATAGTSSGGTGSGGTGGGGTGGGGTSAGSAVSGGTDSGGAPAGGADSGAGGA